MVLLLSAHCIWDMSTVKVLDPACVCVCAHARTWDDSASVGQNHLSALHQGFQDAADVSRSFVGLVNH